MNDSTASDLAPKTWPAEIHRRFAAADVKQVAYVPDAGHKALIDMCHADDTMRAIPLTTEEEGMGVAAGAWLGGQRAVLLMQSSGVGNCINMLSLSANGRYPLLMLVTMRGEWAEFNAWQVPMSRATQPALELMGVHCYRVDHEADISETVAAAADLAFNAEQQVAVLLGQRLIGRKVW